LAIDCGVHEYDLAEWFTGNRVVSVMARNLSIVDPAVAEAGDVDNLVALLDLDGGISAVVDLSRNARYGDDVRTEILGSEGAIFIESLNPAQVTVGRRSGMDVLYESHDDAQAAGVLHQAEAFVAAVSRSLVASPGYEESARAVVIGLAVQEAAGSGGSVTVPHTA
jgi:predicted dehydrogenase